MKKYIIKHYKKDEGTTFISENGDGVMKTKLKSKAVTFKTIRDAKAFINKNGFRWTENFEVENLLGE